ncbi:MAG TPA: hypothetical protein VD866_19265 [Urbifossiella sp.]|nr:hypothetical protein [Urbifossiella sp.]
MSTLFGGRPCVDPVRLRQACLDARPDPLPTDWWGTANLFRNPLGRGPGAGAVLLTKADLDALDLTTDHTLSFDDDRTSARPVELRRITLLRAKCLSPGHRADPRAVYLCGVVDRRHFLAQTPVDAAYNVRDADGEAYLDATTNGGAAWTWQEVVTDLWDALGLTDPSTLPFTPGGAPENLRYHAAGAWESLCDVLDRIACAVKVEHTTDTFTIVRLGDAATTGARALSAELGQADADGLRSWDAYHVEPNRGRLPETVRVLFPRRPVPTDGGSPYFAEDVTLAAVVGVAAGTCVQLFDDLTAVGEGTPTNAAALTARATERAADWRRKRIWFEPRVTLVYRDFRPGMAPGETAEQVAFDDHGGPMTTVLESGPDGRLEAWRPWVPPVGADQAAGAVADCRGTLAGLLPTSRVTFKVLEGSGWCAEIAATNIPGWRPDPDVDEWLSVGTFPTKLGDTSFKFRFAEDDGDPVLLLTGTTGEGSGATTVIQPMTFVGCKNGCPEFAARPLLWCDSGPVTDCDQCPGGAPRRYRTTLAGGTGGYAVLNGEHTFEHDSGCQWNVTTPGFTGNVQWVDQGGGERQLQGQLAYDETGAFVSWSGPIVAASADCCAAVAAVEYADFDPGSEGGSGGSDTPALPTVAAVGPCVSERCADNTFRVRVCCKPHTKYTGCDALPDYSGSWCITGTSGYTGEAAGGALLGNFGPGEWGGGGGGFVGSMFACNTGDAHDYDDTLVRCGWNFYDINYSSVNAALQAVGLYSDPLITVVVYYDPDADDGAGAWVLARIHEYGELGDCQLTVIATAANDPDPTDDPFEIVFRWVAVGDSYHELRIAPGPCGSDEGGCCDGEGEELEGHPDVLLQISEGGLAGDWPMTGGPSWQSGEVVTDHEFRLSCADGVWTMVGYYQGSPLTSGTAISQSCSPFGLVFSKDDFGTAVDLIVVIAP